MDFVTNNYNFDKMTRMTFYLNSILLLIELPLKNEIKTVPQIRTFN